MNLEEYLNSGMKARATAQLLAEGMTKQAGVVDAIKGLFGKFKRAGGRIMEAGKNAKIINAYGEAADDINKLKPIRSQIKGMYDQVGKELSSGRKQLEAAAIKHPITTGMAIATGTTGAAAGVNAAMNKNQELQNHSARRMGGNPYYKAEQAARADAAARGLDFVPIRTSNGGRPMIIMPDKTASAEQQPVSLYKYAADLGCPVAMRLIAHVMEGHGDWLAKVAACAKKNAKCSKVEHKNMPCGK